MTIFIAIACDLIGSIFFESDSSIFAALTAIIFFVSTINNNPVAEMAAVIVVVIVAVIVITVAIAFGATAITTTTTITATTTATTTTAAATTSGGGGSEDGSGDESFFHHGLGEKRCWSNHSSGRWCGRFAMIACARGVTTSRSCVINTGASLRCRRFRGGEKHAKKRVRVARLGERRPSFRSIGALALIADEIDFVVIRTGNGVVLKTIEQLGRVFKDMIACDVMESTHGQHLIA